MVVKKTPSESNSSDTLAYISIILIALCGLYFFFNLTGHAVDTDTAVVNVTVTSQTAINFTSDFVNFGSGAVTAGTASATLDTDGTSTGGSWVPVTDNFTLENIGNTNVQLNLSVGKTPAQFIGGTTPSYQFKFDNNEADSCTNVADTSTWIDTSTAGSNLCSLFSFNDANDTVTIGVKLVIPSDSLAGGLTDTWTATATSL